MAHNSSSVQTAPYGGFDQLSLFEKRLPKKPYHTDDLVTGLKIASLQRAIRSRYIQPNGPTHRYWMVFDIDRPGAAMAWDDVQGPPPNISVMNPNNGHAHLLYGLDVPIRTAPDGSPAPLRYAAAVEVSLREKLGADPSYTGLICKNALNPYWRAHIWETVAYDLDGLADYLDLSQYNGKRKMPDYGLGRNCNLFNSLRQWAYKAIRQGWPQFDAWLAACETRAKGYNSRFTDPLPLNEVRHTAKSVAKYVFNNFSPAGFSEWQSVQGRKGGLKSAETRRAKSQLKGSPWEAEGISRATWYRHHSETNSETAGETRSHINLSQEKPWEALGVSRSTWYRHYSETNSETASEIRSHINLSQEKPWEALGISRSTWYRHKKQALLSETMSETDLRREAISDNSR